MKETDTKVKELIGNEYKSARNEYKFKEIEYKNKGT